MAMGGGERGSLPPFLCAPKIVGEWSEVESWTIFHGAAQSA